MWVREVLVLWAAAAVHAEQQHAATEGTLNPIRKVVTMLQSMQKKVQQEGEQEKELYDKFMCFCSTGEGDLDGSISAANAKIPAVGSEIESSEARLAQAKQDLKQGQTERSDANAAMKDATSLRENEAAAFAAYKADADANTAAIAKAVAALEKGMSGSFLQTPAAAVLSHAVEKSGMPEADRQILAAFLDQSNKYAPQSGEITGILKQMGDTMAANLADAAAAEEKSIGIYKGVMSAKTKEVAATTDTVEAKTEQIGALGVAIVQLKEDLSDTEASLAEDQKFVAELKKGCATKTAEWDERSKTRADELVALADTIKVLNDDDALELFKHTLPSPSFVQVKFSMHAARAPALDMLRKAVQTANRMDRPGLEFIALALAGKSGGAGGFDKVIGMIDHMVGILGTEQRDDDDKKEYCAAQFDLTDDKKKALNRAIDKHNNAIETAKESVATLSEEMAALTAAIKALDKSVAEATEQRKEENAEFKALVASDTAAKEVLAFAKNRLNQFYNPKLYKPPPQRELSAEDRIHENFGNAGGLVTTPAPGGIADTGITALVQVTLHRGGKAAPSPPPATWGAYAAKGGETTGVIAMIDLLIKDLEKELTEAATEEKDSQADYEQMMEDAAEKRTTDSKALASKTSAKAETQSDLQTRGQEKKSSERELMATLKYDSSLHAECDWLLQYFDVRKQARADEVDSLKKAKAVLSGADYSLVQIRGRHFLARH